MSVGERVQGALTAIGASNHEITLRTESELPTPGRSASIAPARALWIYLKHRGVLNIEEFRRTNGRGL